MKVPKQGLTGEVLMREALTEFRAIIDAVRAAVAKKMYPFNTERWVSLEVIYPDHTIASAEDGKKFRFDYTINDAGDVTLGDAVQVKEEFVPVREAFATVENAAFIEAQGEPSTGKWLIRVIKAGLSGNSNFYPDTALKEAVPLFEGVRVFIKSDAEHIKGEGKSVDNLVARLTEAKFVPGAIADTGEILATLEFIEPNGTVSTKVREAYARGMQNLFGFSIDATANAKKTTRQGVAVREAVKITKVLSVDLIVEPGAGGQLIRMVESMPNLPKENDPMRTRMLEAIKAKTPAAYALINPDTITDDQLEAAYREAIAAPATTAGASNTPDVADKVRVLEAQVRLSNTTAAINASTLPQAAKDKLIADFSMREAYDEAAVQDAIKAEREYLGRFAESGNVNLQFDQGARAEDRSVKIAGMLDAFFDPAHADHRQTQSFKECYIEITGDKRVTGSVENIDESRMRESLGVAFRESVSSGSFSNALGNSITRRMQAIYAGQTDLQAWRKVATTTPVNDFRTQERTRIGGYGNLPAVAESGGYTALTTPGDGKATYAVSKRGGFEDVTLEAIKNDDVRAISRIPFELALAAGNTLYEFAFDFYRTNPVIHDTLALYHASHNNLFAGAFSAAEFALHRLAMLKQTRAGSNKRLATQPKFILLPFELQEAGYNAFVRAANLDPTFVQSMTPEIIPVSYWTDANDWCTVADPVRMPVLEIGFLDGNEEPELFVQDMPNVGSLFTNDKITYKIRHIYGGNILVDGEKGTTKAVVA